MKYYIFFFCVAIYIALWGDVFSLELLFLCCILNCMRWNIYSFAHIFQTPPLATHLLNGPIARRPRRTWPEDFVQHWNKFHKEEPRWRFPLQAPPHLQHIYLKLLVKLIVNNVVVNKKKYMYIFQKGGLNWKDIFQKWGCQCECQWGSWNLRKCSVKTLMFSMNTYRDFVLFPRL
jgi:hypothetical protein